MRRFAIYCLAMALGTGALYHRTEAAVPRSAASQDSTDEQPHGGSVRRSSKLAFLMSLVLPGLGELYYGAEKTGAAFMAVEAGAGITFARWNSKGDSIERQFRDFADLHWHEEDYRQLDLNTPQGFYHRGETLPPKQEDAQQYYELIGKYNQFVFGWDDATDGQGRVGMGIPFTVHPSQIRSTNRDSYEDERTRSNRYLKRSSRILGLVVANHLVSAVNASIHARGLQDRIWMDAGVRDEAGPGPGMGMRLNVAF